MKNIGTLLFTACAAFWLICGCAKEQQFTAVEQICLADKGKAEAMAAAEDVLGQMYFSVEKSDVENGYMRSRPLIGGQFFEFWRSDNVGAFNWSEANLHSIRRIVELEITEQGGQLCVVCSANAQRLGLTEQAVDSSTQAYAMFSDSERSMQRLELNPKQRAGMAWIDLGRDGRLETEILKQIEGRLKGESANE
ncbi:MAG: hypothetical protein ACYTE5_07635 [Planctomycetota bacterium]|jgi:protease II